LGNKEDWVFGRIGGNTAMNLVFDVGNVLIRWRPEKAVAHVYPDRQAALASLDRVGFAAWNLANDGGRPFVEAVAELRGRHGAEAEALVEYPAHFGETIREPIEGSWALIERLRARGARLFAITNFAAETWPVALRLHPRLGEVFEDVVVSGQVGLLKPGPEIYRLLLARNGLMAEECLFVDDSAANVAGARSVGMAAHHFTTPALLEADLVARGLV
jgi:haloacid dehalogenase superfamily, subfamily IA, variant 3 with third motif having DD or ED/haloacid dehalogenase superfamily, subfamily IA, variant 1 with third motif having Dx(3-4)D or Dx(3-4)E